MRGDTVPGKYQRDLLGFSQDSRYGEVQTQQRGGFFEAFPEGIFLQYTDLYVWAGEHDVMG
jgi:hypothetical protein